MADEIVDEGSGLTKPALSQREQSALEQGWVPQADWAGDPDDWRPAKEFLDRGELFKKIDELKRENKSIRQGVDEFRKHHDQVRELAYKQALTDLKARKVVALEEGDHATVVELDDKIEDTKQAAKEAQTRIVPEPQGPIPEFSAWEARNAWYKNDRAMKAVADDIAREMIGRGERDPTKILAEVDKQIKNEFPAKFENPNRARAGTVEGTSKGGRTPSKDDVVLTDAEKAIMNKILKTGAITKEKYLAEFKARQAG